MSEMVERVAKAIIAKMAEPSPSHETAGQAAAQLALAAISAMREPTKHMLEQLDLWNCGWGTRDHSRELWAELIDIASAEHVD